MNAVKDFDLGPLTWVKGEISLALERAVEALSQFRAQGDAAQLKLCRTQLHQVHGALAMVGLAGVVEVTGAMEGLAAKLETKGTADAAALEAIQTAIVAVQQYLDGLLVGEPNQPLRLFMPYQALMRAQGKTALPGDLFFPNLDVHPPKRALVALSPDERNVRIHAERNRFQRGMLAWLRQPEGSQARQAGLLQMQEAIRSIESLQTAAAMRGFWRSALGVTTALVTNANPRGDARPICVRIDLQIRRLQEGQAGVAERLMRDALFFIAQSAPQADPLLSELQSTYHLRDLLPTAAQVKSAASATQENALRRLKEFISGAEEQWNRYCSGSVSSLSAFVNQTNGILQMTEQLGNADLKLLAKALHSVAAWLAKQPANQSEGMAMEIATALILIQNARENFARLGADFPQQAKLMAQRLADCAKGKPLAAEAVPLLDEISRRAQDRLLMAQVVREILNNLTQIEQDLDAYFRDPTNTELNFKGLEESLHQVSGALTMLGHDAAVAYLDECRAKILAFRQTEAPDVSVFEDVAQRLSIVGFFIEALQNGPTDFQSFLYGMLHPRALGAEPAAGSGGEEAPTVSVERQVEQLRADIRHRLDAVKANPGDLELRQGLEAQLKALQKDADLVADQTLAAQVKSALAALKEISPEHTQSQIEQVAEVLAPIDQQPKVAAPSAETLTLAQSSDDAVDAELLEIFLEEAGEVLQTIADHLEMLRQQPHDLDTLTTIRRGSHTLKGSGRMVGLRELGEVAWAVEQTLNLWLNQKQEATPELLEMIESAHRVFSDWIEHLQTHDGRVPNYHPLVDLAERLRGGHEVRLGAPTSAAAPRPESRPSAASAAGGLVLEAPTFAGLEPKEPGGLGEPDAGTSAEMLPESVDVDRQTAEVPADLTDDVATSEPEETASFEALALPASEQATEGERKEEGAAPDVQDHEFREPAEEAPAAAEPGETASDDRVLPEAESSPPSALSWGADLLTGPVEPRREPTVEPAPEAPAETQFFPEETPGFVGEETPAFLGEAAIDFVAPEPPAELTAETGAEQTPETSATTASPETAAATDTAASLETSEMDAASDFPDISPQIFQIFRDEAESYMERLRAFIAELTRTPEMPTTFESHRAAHTLAGIAGTLGFMPVHELSHALEQALLRRGETENPGSLEGQEVLRQTVDALAGMLARIDAGRMPHAEPALIDALEPLYPPQPKDESAAALAELEAFEHDASEDLPELADAEPEDVTKFPDLLEELTPEPESIPEPMPELAPVAVESPPVAASVPPVAVAPATSAEDVLDPDLLPIFLEEAGDLVAGLYRSIGEWRENPASEAAAQGLARVLHTFKGSARMVGAMHLGEFTHELESRVGELSGRTAMEADLDAIEAACDVMARVVDAYQVGNFAIDAWLKTPETAESEAAESVAASAPEPEPLPEVAPTPEVLVLETPAPEMLAPEIPIAEEEKPAPKEAEQNEFSGAAKAAPREKVAETPVPEVEPHAPAAHVEDMRAQLRVRADLVDQLVNEAGEMAISRTRIEGEMRDLKESLLTLTDNVIRLRNQLREIEIQAETQIQAGADESKAEFDPLELDRFTRFQELTRMMAESVNDVGTVQQNLLKNLDDANAAIVAQARLNRSLQQSLMGVRMLPFESQSDRLHRLVRQIGRELNKRAHLEIVGGQVELDRFVLEQVFSPLEHMIRNAVAHGLEAEDVRVAAGKPPVGLIRLVLTQEGNEIILALSDDGAGLDMRRIREKAENSGLIEPGSPIDDRQLMDFIFKSGFSTARQISQVAGRGVGMDVVKSGVSALGGRIEVLTEAGKGTTFRLYLPLTLAVTQTVLVRAGGREHAIPSSMIEQVMEIREKVLTEIRARGEAIWQTHHFPFHYLPRLLGDDVTQLEPRPLYWVLLLRSGTQRVAVLVDDLIGNQEVVVKNVGPQMARVVGISGATVLGDGQIALILNPVALAMRAPLLAPPMLEPAALQQRQPVVLVVDDSLTVRKITQKLLTREGYHVELAKDGVDAMEKLVDLHPDVILSDIEMPRMDGFDLVRHLRADERLEGVPVIMITSRTAEKHRNLAMEIGANHYLGKPYDEAELLGILDGYTKALRPA